MEGIKVVIDTSVWVSIVRNREVNTFIRNITMKNIKIFVCGELIDELFDVLYRPKHYKTHNKEIEVFFDEIEKVPNYVSIKFQRKFNDCRDPADNYLFDLAIQSQADYLVSGDDDVLDVKINPPPQIISFTEFREMFF